MEITLTKENFAETIRNSEKPVLVDFWATWCGPCRMQAPVLEELAAERGDIVVGKVNVDDEAEIANAFQIDSIPTIILIKNGEAVKAAVGYRNKDQLVEMLAD